MYLRNRSDKNGYYKGMVPPPFYGGTALRNERGGENRDGYDKPDKKEAPPLTRTHIHSPDGSERLISRRPVEEDIGMFSPFETDQEAYVSSAEGEHMPPEPTCSACEDAPRPPIPQKPPAPQRPPVRPFPGAERPDDLILAALIAMLFGSRCDDELLLMLVLLYIMGL